MDDFTKEEALEEMGAGTFHCDHTRRDGLGTDIAGCITDRAPLGDM